MRIRRDFRAYDERYLIPAALEVAAKLGLPQKVINAQAKVIMAA
jgi:hypothetical protein